MSTVSRSRPLNGNGNFVALAGLPKSEDISSPLPFVEICGQERTSIIGKHRIDTHNERGAVRVGPAQMTFDRHFIYGQECLIWTCRTFNFWFFANPTLPLIRTGRCVAAPPRRAILPTDGEDI